MAEDTELTDWFDHVTGTEWFWYVKYLSANDTYAKKNVHQGGPYISKDALRLLFPRLEKRANRVSNPDLTLPAEVDSHGAWDLTLRLVWYNSKRLGQKNGRDEARLTRWGGLDAPVVSAGSTGSLTIFAFHRAGQADSDGLRVWVARDGDDHDRIIDRVGPVEPGAGILLTATGILLAEAPRLVDRPCHLTEKTLPPGWRRTFPPGEELIGLVVASLPSVITKVEDERLLLRRACEYEMFRSVEEYHVLPRLQEKFATVDLFVEFAHIVTNRRKSRSGRSLELHLARIFDEESLSYSAGKHTEGHRRPDFVFPSMEKYWDGHWPDERLRMLGAKTTVKDRWRQILNEARRVQTKHLLTLQEGVSEEQFREMRESGVALVAPKALHKFYPQEVRSRLTTLAAFVKETRAVCG